MSEKPSNVVPEATTKPSSADVAVTPTPANIENIPSAVAQSKATIPGKPPLSDLFHEEKAAQAAKEAAQKVVNENLQTSMVDMTSLIHSFAPMLKALSEDL